MKVLAIIGSPKGKGNTYEVVRRVEEKMRGAGDVEFEYLFLRDVNLQPCRGCYICFDKGEDRCPLRDDRASIEERIQRADGVIFASPTYIMNVSGLMKNFIDRLGYVSHRPRFFKPALIVSTTGGVMVQITLWLLQLTAEAWGFEVVGRLGVAVDPYQEKLPEAERARRGAVLEQKTARAARRLGAAMQPKQPAPGVIKVAGFLVRKHTFEREIYRVDHDYWEKNGWLQPGVFYFYDVRLGPVKKLAAKLASYLLIKFF